MAAGRLYCVTCNEEREIVEVKTYQGFDEKILSCGHSFKLFKVNITEIVGLPQLSGSKGIEIRPKTSGVVPVTISGDSGAKLDGFLDPHLNFKQIGDNVEVNAPVNLFIAESLSYQSSSTITSTHNISHVDTTINITSIIDQVNASDHSPEEKEMIKQILDLLQRIK